MTARDSNHKVKPPKSSPRNWTPSNRQRCHVKSYFLEVKEKSWLCSKRLCYITI